jgi:very-short-patch-repair endonuclease
VATENRWTWHRKRTVAARELRARETEAEKILWQWLKNRRLGGFKFRRQFPIGPYFADFCCIERRLIVELDGELHANTLSYDENRTYALIQLGFDVVRFPNSETVKNPAAVCQVIRSKLTSLSLDVPSPRGRGRQVARDTVTGG